jgi:IS30 family transposase
MWGLNVVGPFHTAPGGYKHILVAIDKFTKWIVVRPIAKVMSEEAVKFIGDIKHRFGVPNRIITDLGKAFTGSVFWDFCQDNLIDVYYSSVAHPRCNGQVERANGMVLQALKDSIYDDASNYATRWLAELPHVIWGLRTQVSSRLFTLLSGLQIRSCTTYRRRFRSSTDPVLRGRRGRANT